MNFDTTASPTDRRRTSRCVARGTRVETPSGLKPIEEIQVGEFVWGFNSQRREPVLAKVVSVESSSADRTLRIGELRVTADHLISAEGKWKCAADLQPKDRLIGSDLTIKLAGQPEIIDGQIEVFDLAVARVECFFAGGVLVRSTSAASSDAP